MVPPDSCQQSPLDSPGFHYLADGYLGAGRLQIHLVVHVVCGALVAATRIQALLMFKSGREDSFFRVEK